MEPLFEAKYEQLLENLKEKAETGKPVEIKEQVFDLPYLSNFPFRVWVNIVFFFSLLT